MPCPPPHILPHPICSTTERLSSAMGLVRPSRGSWLTTPSSPRSGVGAPPSSWHPSEVGGTGCACHARGAEAVSGGATCVVFANDWALAVEVTSSCQDAARRMLQAEVLWATRYIDLPVVTNPQLSMPATPQPHLLRGLVLSIAWQASRNQVVGVPGHGCGTERGRPDQAAGRLLCCHTSACKCIAYAHGQDKHILLAWEDILYRAAPAWLHTQAANCIAQPIVQSFISTM